MKKLLAILLMAPAIVFANSEPATETPGVYREKSVYCTDWKTVQEKMKGYEEVRIASGHAVAFLKEVRLQPLIIYANMETGTFTILEKSTDGLWCFVNHGENFNLFPIRKSKK